MRTLSINGKALGNHVTLLSIDYGYATVTNYNDWLKHSMNPVYYGQDITYTTAEIELLVEAANIGTLEIECSNVYSQFKGECVVADSAVEFTLNGHVTGITEERIGPKARVLKIQFEGIKTGLLQKETIVLGLTDNILYVDGNTPVATAIHILPEKNYVTLTIIINDRQYVLKDVQYVNDDPGTNEITIDGINGTISRSGAVYVDHYDSWEMPKLDGGINNVRCLEGYPTVTFEFSGRWT